MNTEHDDDLVDYGIDDEVPDHEMASVSGKAEEVDADESRTLANTDALATDAELRLTRRVLDLERERDALAAEVKTLRARYPAHSTRIPVAPSAEGDAPAQQPIEIPHDLIPVLALLRQHIAELTRDNMALRYTFLGPSSSRLDAVSPASSMATTPLPATSPLPSVAGMSPMPLAALASPPAPTIEITEVGPAAGAPGVDLAAVVDRVRVLTLENEELGEMVAEAGRADASEWLKTLEDSKQVIASLDSDLQHNLTVIEGLRTELESYKTRFGSVDAPPKAATVSSPQSQDKSRDNRDRNQPRNDRRRNGGGGGGGGGGGREDRYRPEHGRESRDSRDGRDGRDRRGGGDGRGDGRSGEGHRSGGGGDRGGGDRSSRQHEDKPVPGSSLAILGRANATGENGGASNGTTGGGGGARRVDDDRASKRRR